MKNNGLVADCCIYKQLSMWDWEVVFRTSFVYVPEVNANLNFLILFLDLRRIYNMGYYTSLIKLVFTNLSISASTLASRFG